VVVSGVLLVVRVEASVEVVGWVCTDSFSSLGRTNPGGKIFDTSSVEMGKTDIPFSFVVENTSELVSSSSSSMKNCGLSVWKSGDS